PRRTARSPSTTRRVTARMRAQVNSATALVSTSGVLVTTMPRARAAARSMLSKPAATLAMIRSDDDASITAASIGSVSWEMMASTPAARATISAWGQPSRGAMSTVARASRGASTLDGNGLVTSTEGTGSILRRLLELLGKGPSLVEAAEHDETGLFRQHGFCREARHERSVAFDSDDAHAGARPDARVGQPASLQRAGHFDGVELDTLTKYDEFVAAQARHHGLDAERGIAEHEIGAGAMDGLDVALVGDAADDAQRRVESPAIHRQIDVHRIVVGREQHRRGGGDAG